MEHTLDIKIESRFFTHGNAATAHTLILALHGYGQLAPYFQRHFEWLNPNDYLVVVPEGLHRFYLNGSSGRVGASWMTKENREADIRNYIHYLNQVMTIVTDQKKFQRSVLLGFSQGGATASRFLAKGLFTFDAFVLWAAVFPPDMQPLDLSGFSRSKNFLVLGTRDEYYKSKDFVIELEKLNKTGLNFKLVEFDGTHTINPTALMQVLDEI